MKSKKQERKTTRTSPAAKAKKGHGRVKGTTSPIEAAPVPVQEEASVVESASVAEPFDSAQGKPAPEPPSFPIVGIGASAGGLAALEAFFANMPTEADGGMAFVIVQHLDPGHKSILTDLVRRYTPMRVFEAEEGMRVEPDCVYIIPPNKDMALMHDTLHLLEPAAPRGLRLPIDFFFRSLAQDRGEQSICIVLSGTGTDGTLGVRAVKEVGGMAMAQTPESTNYDGMPRSAIATGLVDYVLPPGEMPKRLITYVQQVFGRKKKGEAAPPVDVTNWIQRILVLLRSATGHDFSAYKHSTIRRRVERRMAVHQIERIEQYVQYLRQNEAELHALFRELLIGVTSFFRDPQAFQSLMENAIKPIVANCAPGSSIRVWTPACSTGEEAYSIAILLLEEMERIGRQFTTQVFATDIDQVAIEKARQGLYPANIAADVSPERLGRFFTQEGKDSYRVKKAVRDMVIFAEQDVIKDPPFSKIDLISCRNLLIYMEAELQRKVVPLFHYALAPGGFLFLGNAESVGEFTNLFETLDHKWKLYKRKESPFQHGVMVEMPVRAAGVRAEAILDEPIKLRNENVNVREITERALLGEYAPTCVTVNARGDILYIYGRTGKYLELTTGEANLNILHTAREGLRLELATALRKVATVKKPVRYEGLTVKVNGGMERVNLIVKPAGLGASGNDAFLVIFEPFSSTRSAASAPKTRKSSKPDDLGSDKDRHIAALERELQIKEEYLKTTVEELERINEELKSANEELQSTNEELQSTNEELETSREELQSLNEELVTVNTELQQKIDGLSRANNDMNNLMAGTGVGTIFVDHQQRIQRFTPAVTRIIPLLASDIGRPLEHFAFNLAHAEDLKADIQSVLDNLIPRESEVQTKDGQWYLMRILPYRTLENVIEGAVLTFFEITELKRLQESLRDAEAKFRMAFDTNPVALSITTLDGRYVDVNDAFCKTLGYTREELLGKTSAELGIVDAELRSTIVEKIDANGGMPRYEVQVRTRDGRLLTFMSMAETITLNGVPHRISINVDITERKQMEEEIRRLNAELDQRVRQATDELTAANARLQRELAERKRAEETIRK